MKRKRINIIGIATIILLLVGMVFVSIVYGDLNIQTQTGVIKGSFIDRGKGKLVIIIPGSGPTDRDGNSMMIDGKNDSLRMLANALEGKGVSSYRYDKRTETDLLFDDFVDDLVSVIKYFRDEGYEDITLAGHSQGALVSFIAANNESVERVISLSGAGYPIDIIIAKQLGVDSIESFMEMVKNDEPFEGQLESLKMLFNKEVLAFLESWIKYNPAKELMNISVPVLLVRGTNDLQVFKEDINILRETKPDAKVLIVEDMNHVLKIVEDEKENMESYTSINYKISDILIEEMMKFLSE
jgi:pimeloyl-ACP methyl ester carboxylesterase